MKIFDQSLRQTLSVLWYRDTEIYLHFSTINLFAFLHRTVGISEIFLLTVGTEAIIQQHTDSC